MRRSPDRLAATEGLGAQDASDERWLAGWCGCSTRLLRPIVERLIGKGKLSLRAGMLVNDRANKELREGRSREAPNPTARIEPSGALPRPPFAL
jgi:hypothetical protein